MNTNVYVWGTALLLATNAWGASCTDPGPPQTFYVSTFGNNNNDGLSPTTAFRDIQKGVDCVGTPGDRLVVLPGTYPELVRVYNKKGQPGNPIVIEGMLGITPEPAVAILGTVTRLANTQHVFQFHTGSAAAPNNEWTAIGNGEYISTYTVPGPPNNTDWEVHQGAFIDPANGSHTRLITYHRIEDLQAANETFEEIVDGCPMQDPRPGPVLRTTPEGCTVRRPWVYMGPGLWFDKTTKKVHIRLSPTHNNVPGLADYTGETDPNKVALAIAEKGMGTLNLEASSYIQFKNLAIDFSSVTMWIKNTSDIAFDNVTIRAGRFGARAGGSARLAFSNCVFDGGLPTWMFRGDVKDEYDFIQGGVTLTNSLGKQTLGSLIGMEGVSSVDVHHCEFRNGHDLYLQASAVSFHHNWIRNMHDDALFLDASADNSGSVHHNVIEQALTAFSFDGRLPAGAWNIYRNLVDLRLPTAGFRPRNAGSDRSHVWRPGSTFKEGNTPEGAYHIFQNTFIVPFAAEYPLGQPEYPQASFRHLRNSLQPMQGRSSLNNAFVVLNREAGVDAPIAFLLPPNTNPGVSIDLNGDLFYRRGYGTKLFATPIPGDLSHFHLFSCLPSDNCRTKWLATPFFQSTLTADPPGYEPNAVLLQDPQFLFWNGEPTANDDFRLTPGSPARATGVPLPAPLLQMDTDAAGITVPDIGAYQTKPGTDLALKLRVGVRSRRVYPQTGAGN